MSELAIELTKEIITFHSEANKWANDIHNAMKWMLARKIFDSATMNLISVDEETRLRRLLYGIKI